MTFLEGPVLAFAILGMTHYVDIGRPDPAVIYYESAREAHMVLPGAPAMKGELTMLGSGYHVAWADGPSGDWKIARDGEAVIYIDGAGERAGTIIKIVPGNPEGLE